MVGVDLSFHISLTFLALFVWSLSLVGLRMVPACGTEVDTIEKELARERNCALKQGFRIRFQVP